MNITERFENKYVISEDSCWNWIATISGKTGYGNFNYFGVITKAHRVSYLLKFGHIPDGKQLDHLCRNRLCVNPYHLEPVTIGENIRRGSKTKVICEHGVGYSNCSDGCSKEYRKLQQRRLRATSREKGN